MSLTIGEKDKIKEARKRTVKGLKNSIKKECLVVALAMLKEGQVRKAYDAMLVYNKVEKK